MRLTITRGGGLGGIVTETVLDGATLSDADRATLAERARAVVPVADAPPQPDSTLYRLRVEDGDAVEATYTDATLPEDVRTLVAWADEHPQRRARIVR